MNVPNDIAELLRRLRPIAKSGKLPREYDGEDCPVTMRINIEADAWAVVACVRLERPFVGIEIEPRYFAMACRRIERAWREKRSRLPMEKPKREVQPEMF